MSGWVSCDTLSRKYTERDLAQRRRILWFIDRSNRKLFVLEGKCAEYNDGVGLLAVLDSFEIFRLFPRFPEGVDPRVHEKSRIRR